MTDEDRNCAALRDRCTRFLAGHGPVNAAAMLATIPADTKPDTYGQGGVVAELEAEICRLLGKPAATFLPVRGDGAAGRAQGARRRPATAGPWFSTRCATWSSTRSRPISGCTG